MKKIANIEMNQKNSNHSFARQYIAKLLTNIFGLAVSFVNISVLPKSLSAKSYGSYEFLVSFFDNLKGIWDPSVSTGFFNKLSRRNNDFGLYRFFSIYSVIVGIAIFGGIVFVNFVGIQNSIWPGESFVYILLAGIFGYLAWISESFRKVSDAYGLTVSSEMIILCMRLLGAITVLVLFFYKKLNVYSLFIKEIIILILIRKKQEYFF